MNVVAISPHSHSAAKWALPNVPFKSPFKGCIVLNTECWTSLVKKACKSTKSYYVYWFRGRGRSGDLKNIINLKTMEVDEMSSQM